MYVNYTNEFFPELSLRNISRYNILCGKKDTNFRLLHHIRTNYYYTAVVFVFFFIFFMKISNLCTKPVGRLLVDEYTWISIFSSEKFQLKELCMICTLQYNHNNTTCAVNVLWCSHINIIIYNRSVLLLRDLYKQIVGLMLLLLKRWSVNALIENL